MKFIIIACFLSLAFSASFISKEFVENLKKIAPFEVYEPEESPFRDWTMEELKQMLGDLEDEEEFKDPLVDLEDDSLKDFPATYDFRKSYPDCIGQIKDQGSCGSCWAFAGSTAFQQKYCHDYKEKYHQANPIVLSPQHSVSCDTSNHGCNGGNKEKAWAFYKKTGLVEEHCFPYTSGSSGKVPACINKCVDGSAWVTHKVSSYDTYIRRNSMKDIISHSGPIHTSFTVYNDFFSYKGGIYKHVTGAQSGRHSVVIVGYGNEGGVEYWICQNSWGSYWGESGFFRIKFGECGIDDKIVTGNPIV